ncbi:hypothetical protein M422DRAFT_271913 [Sphaerobolus stellatus SS14]|uniref:F-box domain-containing protein n=1 Tax=Sphaerobolus stellatus (strain SS14) TaxID=990650 RepID=A0A0C9UNB7_SPHS4|nr:hypothetical protein M422DRAFT_271913 [Sphaerobolus stellatus SS14]
MSHMQASGSTAFPPELWEPIIAHLHGDTSSLLNCGLVCWEWNAISRLHIFSEVTLLVQFPRDVLVQVMSAEGSTIGRYIRELDILAADDEGWNAILENLPSLPALRTLSLSNVEDHWKSLTSRAKSKLDHVFQSVTNLSISRATFESFNQACEFINNASQVEELVLWSVYCESYEKSELRLEIILPKLSQISVDGGVLIPLFDQLCSQTNAPSIRILTVACRKPSDAHAICKYIASLGPILEELSLFVDDGERYTALSNQMDLSLYSSLRVVTFDLTWYTDPPKRQAAPLID